MIQLISEIKEILKDENDVDNTHFFQVNARIIKFKTDQESMYYLACPKKDCKKKVKQDASETSFYCEACNRHYLTCLPTYIF